MKAYQSLMISLSAVKGTTYALDISYNPYQPLMIAYQPLVISSSAVNDTAYT